MMLRLTCESHLLLLSTICLKHLTEDVCREFLSIRAQLMCSHVLHFNIHSSSGHCGSAVMHKKQARTLCAGQQGAVSLLVQDIGHCVWRFKLGCTESNTRCIFVWATLAPPLS